MVFSSENRTLLRGFARTLALLCLLAGGRGFATGGGGGEEVAKRTCDYAAIARHFTERAHFFSYEFADSFLEHGDSPTARREVTRILSRLPRIPVEGDLKASLITDVLRKLYPGQDVIVDLPETLGKSGDPVFMVVRLNGQPTHVVKFYPNEADSLARELAGLEILRKKLPDFVAVTEVENAFVILANDRTIPVLVMKRAPGRDLSGILRNMGSEPLNVESARGSFAAAGTAIAEVHKAFRRIANGSAGERAYIEYERKRILSLVGEATAAKGPVGEGWMSVAEAKALAASTETALARFQSGGMRHASLIHGDFHTGNIVCDGPKCTIIDAQTSISSIEAPNIREPGGIASADPLSDVARFIESIEHARATGRVPAQSANAMREEFLRAYFAATGDAPASADASLAFHRLRYSLLQFSEHSQRSPAERCMALDDLLRRHGIRPGSAISPCR